jgi:hypothetical protein
MEGENNTDPMPENDEEFVNTKNLKKNYNFFSIFDFFWSFGLAFKNNFCDY